MSEAVKADSAAAAPPPAASRLVASHLAKSYGSRKVVKDVSLVVAKGEVVGLLGPNGAGKTTSFYMIVGLVRAAGRIRRERRTEGPMTPSENIPSVNSAEDNIADRQKKAQASAPATPAG